MSEKEQWKAMRNSVEAAIVVAEILKARGTAAVSYGAGLTLAALKDTLREIEASEVVIW